MLTSICLVIQWHQILLLFILLFLSGVTSPPPPASLNATPSSAVVTSSASVIKSNCTIDADCLDLRRFCFKSHCYKTRVCNLTANASHSCGNNELCHPLTHATESKSALNNNGSIVGMCICQPLTVRSSLTDCVAVNKSSAGSTGINSTLIGFFNATSSSKSPSVNFSTVSGGSNSSNLTTPVGPTAAIRPTSLTVELPNVVLLDGSASSPGSSPIEAYAWETVDGPLLPPSSDAESASSGPAWRQQVLRVTLAAGSYKIRLTVRDANRLSDSASANVTVLPARDSPPRASAGSGVVLYLPNNRVNLTGGASTDDRGIVSYAWTQVGEPLLSADMQGAHTKDLRLSGLVEGEYKFQLTVADAAGQTDSANVTVLVKRRGPNRPPVVRVVPERLTVRLPRESVNFSAEASDDTGVIAGWLWEQLLDDAADDGKKKLRLLNATTQTVTVTDLRAGKDFRLRVTATDQDGANSSAVASLTVLPGPNQPPRALIAPVPARLQLDGTAGQLMAIDGSASYDDKLVTAYRWTRLSNSSTGGDALNGSANQSVLLLANLLPGRYAFRLTVSDAEGSTNSAIVDFLAVAWPSADAVVVLELGVEPSRFAQKDADGVLNQLKLAAHGLKPLGGWTAPASGGAGLVQLRLVADNGTEGAYLSGEKLVATLRRRLLPDALDFPIVDLRTETCQLACSGRGQCDPVSRACRCPTLWMANPFAGGPNCDWSVIYVCLAGFVALLVCLPPSRCLLAACRRRCFRHRRSRQQRRRRRQKLRRNHRRRRRRSASSSDLVDSDMSNDYDYDEDEDYEDDDQTRPVPLFLSDDLQAVVTRRSAAVVSATPQSHSTTPPDSQSSAGANQQPPAPPPPPRPPSPASKEK